MFRKLFNNRIITIISIITNIMMVMTMFSPDELADMAIHSESDSVRDELSSGIRFDDNHYYNHIIRIVASGLMIIIIIIILSE